MDVRLTPCPFCGGVPFVWQNTKGTHIQCGNWDMQDDNGHVVLISANTLEEAIKKWQSRFIMRESLKEARERVLNMIE